jgi:hypothetical protein
MKETINDDDERPVGCDEVSREDGCGSAVLSGDQL